MFLLNQQHHNGLVHFTLTQQVAQQGKGVYEPYTHMHDFLFFYWVIRAARSATQAHVYGGSLIRVCAFQH
jgi:hypothetical protein